MYNDRNADIDNDSSSSGTSLPRQHTSLPRQHTSLQLDPLARQLPDMDSLRAVSLPNTRWTVDEEEEEQVTTEEASTEPTTEVPPTVKQFSDFEGSSLQEPTPSLQEEEKEGMEEKKVSFMESLDPGYPLINIISSTPVMDPGAGAGAGAGAGEGGVLTEPHDSIKAKFDEIIDTRFIRISQYSDQFLILRPDPSEVLDNFTFDRQTALFMKMSCSHTKPGTLSKVRTEALE